MWMEVKQLISIQIWGPSSLLHPFQCLFDHQLLSFIPSHGRWGASSFCSTKVVMVSSRDGLWLANVGPLCRARALSSDTSGLTTALTLKARIASACHLPTSFQLAVRPRSPRPPKNQSFQEHSAEYFVGRVSTWLVRDARRNWSNQ